MHEDVKKRTNNATDCCKHDIKWSESDIEREKELGRQLKELCYANGREKEPKKSAAIFHQLGLLYMKRSPDKICLIQAAALLNAAIVREPEDVTAVKNDLERLCSTILSAAGVAKENVNLVSAAQSCKNAIIQFRHETVDEAQKLHFISESLDQPSVRKIQKKKIEEVRNLQNFITDNYASIMSYLSDYCLSIMGEPPSLCRFALVGMGSLAKREITPYSDFENVIVLEEGSQLKENYSDILEYFQWFSVIFQIILINIGETVVPSIAIPSLNDFSVPGGDWFFDAFTPRGISFDGLMPYACKSPLGRQQVTRKKSFTTELIKPSSAMAQFLDRDQHIKNGYHLADVLSKTCFVSGDRRVYDDFIGRVNQKLASRRKDQQKFANEIKKQITDDKLKFDVNSSCSNMYATSKFNLKRVIYRSTTIFVSALGTYLGYEEASCFDILERMRDDDVISAKECHHLKYAVAIACETRLKIYLKRKKQSDWIENRTLGSELSEILRAVGGRTIVDYFTIARAFQTAVASLDLEDRRKALKLQLNLDYKYSVDICCKLRLHKTCIQVCKNIVRSRKSTFDTSDIASCYYYTGISLLDLQKPRRAIKYFKKELGIRLNHENGSSKDLIADSYYNIGRCYANMRLFEKAFTYFNRELDIRKELTKDESKDSDIAYCSREIGSSLLNLRRPEEALKKFEFVLEIWRNVSSDESTDVHIIHCLAQIGICKVKLQQYDQAVEVFTQEIEKRKKRSSDENSDFYVAECQNRIGVCLMNLEKYQDALHQFQQESKILSNLGNPAYKNVEVARCVYNISLCQEMLSKS